MARGDLSLLRIQSDLKEVLSEYGRGGAGRARGGARIAETVIAGVSVDSPSASAAAGARGAARAAFSFEVQVCMRQGPYRGAALVFCVSLAPADPPCAAAGGHRAHGTAAGTAQQSDAAAAGATAYRYPFSPPRVRCPAPLWHPNVDLLSGDCHLPLLQPGAWSPVLRLSAVVLELQLLLLEPTADFPVNLQATELFLADARAFERMVHKTLQGGVWFGLNFPDRCTPAAASTRRARRYHNSSVVGDSGMLKRKAGDFFDSDEGGGEKEGQPDSGGEDGEETEDEGDADNDHDHSHSSRDHGAAGIGRATGDRTREALLHEQEEEEEEEEEDDGKSPLEMVVLGQHVDECADSERSGSTPAAALAGLSFAASGGKGMANLAGGAARDARSVLRENLHAMHLHDPVAAAPRSRKRFCLGIQATRENASVGGQAQRSPWLMPSFCQAGVATGAGPGPSSFAPVAPVSSSVFSFAAGAKWNTRLSPPHAAPPASSALVGAASTATAATAAVAAAAAAVPPPTTTTAFASDDTVAFPLATPQREDTQAEQGPLSDQHVDQSQYPAEGPSALEAATAGAAMAAALAPATWLDPR